MKSYILLENVEIYAKHGVFEQENVVGNNFVVNIKLEVDITKACLSDQLTDTVSYAEVYDIIEQEMAQTAKLLEHVGYRIVDRLKKTYSEIGQIELKISKKNPPVRGQVEQASIILLTD